MSSPKTFIVTGASRGIGLATAKYLLAAPHSHNVVVLARSAEPLQQLKDQYPQQVAVLSGDLADLSLGQQAVDLALSSFGGLDGLVLNHGWLGQVAPIAEADPAQWQQGFAVNFFSGVAFVKAALPTLRQSHGRIIFTSSAAGVKPIPAWGLYGASKAAMNHLARTLGEEEPAVTTVSIDPGLVDTEMQREIREDLATAMESQLHSFFTSAHKAGGLSKPEQPGHVIAKLVVGAPKELSGRFIEWNDQVLRAFQ
ncbi:SDR family oxidoreductase [Aspergillus saccharolyticus JOP 1030-1]|uniref:Short-chain dehydrogenase n=1 Tax=Aspergillus saccharolyticus JOP 1030-1 TaxID=1450539 RepID=A0A318ZVE2_9EURO|nr:short-chain dehydrogenase [Aspergillus saccharolyticus JOP 1030-1]PYH44098.1 short-chain dehydrogenase [Aspergillus saccharolyticus JOP 1030-1]